MQYPVEEFTPEERAALEPHFTNLDKPVFALVNLPETVKGALFARYSRYPGTLRRLFLDEFADSLPEGAGFDVAVLALAIVVIRVLTKRQEAKADAEAVRAPQPEAPIASPQPA